MGAHRRVGHHQFFGDGAVGIALGQQLQHMQFLARERLGQRLRRVLQGIGVGGDLRIDAQLLQILGEDRIAARRALFECA